MNAKGSLFRAIGAGVVMCAVASATNAAVISVNFVGGQNGPGGAASVSAGNSVGAVPALNWNNESGASGTSLPLVDSTGSASGATITYSAPNTWAATGSAPGGGGNADLMSGYLDSGGPNLNTITVSGLPAAFTSGGYQVLVYQNSDSAGSWGFKADDNAAHSDTRYGQQLTGGNTNYPLGGPNGFTSSTSTNPAGPGTAANYVILGSVTPFTGSSFTITDVNGTTGDGRPRPNGIQIVSVPEPASVGLLGIAGGTLLMSRRRRNS